jgi:hypothetical protein
MSSMFLPQYLKCPKCGAIGFALKEESRSGFQAELDMAVTGNFWVRKAGDMGFAAYCLKCNVRASGPYISKRNIGP